MSSRPATDLEGDAARAAKVEALAAQRAVGQLTAMLGDGCWLVRRAVVSALAGLGEAADAALIEDLQTERTDEARIAATVDALVGSTSLRLDAALSALAHEPLDSAVLADIAQILGRRRSRSAYEALTLLTRHDDDNVAVAAIEALGRLGGRAAMDALLACLETKHFFRTFPAIDVLGRSGDPRAVAPLSALLSDTQYAREAARALGRSGDRSAVTPLLSLLSSPSDGNVRVACLALVELCERHGRLFGSEEAVCEAIRNTSSEGIVRRLSQSTARADKSERIAICRLLGILGRESALSTLSTFWDDDADVADAAGRALLEIGRANESALTDALVHGDAKRRKVLLPIVGQRASAAAVQSCLADENAEVRVLSCAALARIGAVTAVPELFTLLADAHPRVVNAALAAIQSLGSGQTEALALSAARVACTRRPALRVLAYFGFASAVPLFVEAISDPDPRIRDIGFQGLALIELPEARAVLLTCSAADDPAVRGGALRSLGHSDDPSLTPHLLAHLRDRDAWVRYYACQALGRRKDAGIEAELLPLVQDAAGQVRVGAVEALAQLGSASAVLALRSLVDHEDSDLRRAALVGLGMACDEMSLPSLLTAAQEGDPTTRLVALSTLTRFQDERVIALLLTTARSGSDSLRVAALNLLAELPGEPAAGALLQLLLEDNESNALVSALAKDLTGRVSALEKGLAGADEDQARVLMACLARSRAEGAYEAMHRAASSKSVAVRRAVAGALSGLNTQDARALLAEMVVMDPDPEVRSVSRLHLESL